MKTANFPIIKFKEIERLNPCWSSWICFCEIIRGRKNLSRKIIRKYFNEFINKDDYLKRGMPELLKYLYQLAEK